MPHAEVAVFLLKSKEVQQVILQLQDVVNGLDDKNVLVGGFGLDKLKWLEWPILLVGGGAAVTTTTSADAGGFLVFDPAKYITPTTGKWYFEAAIKISDVAQTVTAKLMNGATVVGTATNTGVGSDSYQVRRSAALTMPVSQATLTVKLESSNAAATASLWTARLIFAPQG